MGLTSTLKDIGDNFTLSIPEEYKLIITFFIYFAVIAVYSIFIWKFYRFLAKRDIIKLNLKQYNYTKHPALNKFFASILYILEYIIIMPILVLFWFSVFAFFMLILSKTQTVPQILIISAAVIGAVRFTSYISEDLSRDIAKAFPFTILVIFLIDPNFFSLPILIIKLLEVPSLFSQIIIYLGIVASLEIIIRLVYTIVEFFSSSDE